MDIKAIEILRGRAQAHKAIDVSVTQDIAKLQIEVTQTTKETVARVTDVSKYVEQIEDELTTAKSVIGQFNKSMGKAMEQLLKRNAKRETDTSDRDPKPKWISTEDKERSSVQSRTMGMGSESSLTGSNVQTSTSTSTPGVSKGDSFDLKILRHQLDMQKMVEQQLYLLEVMNKTEEILLRAEKAGRVSLSDMKCLEQNLKAWEKLFDADDDEEKTNKKQGEQKKRRHEDKKKMNQKSEEEEKEKRKREEEKKKKREEEEKRKREEEKKKQEEEQKRKREEEEKKKGEEEENRKREEEKKKQEEEQKRKREEEEKKNRKEEEKRKHEEEKRKKEEEEKRKHEEEKRKKEEEEKRKREEEKRKKEEEEKRKREEEKRKKEEEEKRKREEEKRKKEEEEKRKREEEKRKKEEEEKRKREEEKRKKEEEEKRKREEEKRKKEEEEKRKREEEKRKKEEEEKRKREEEKRIEKEKQNWPVFKYQSSGSTDTHHSEEYCFVSAVYGSLLQEDLICTWSSNKRDLEQFREGKDEIIMSSVVTVKTRSGTQIKPELPLRIFIPCDKSRYGRETIVKMAVDEGEIKVSKTLHDFPNSAQKDSQVIGTEVDRFRRLDIVVISRARRQNLFMSADGGTFEASQNNIDVTVPTHCFPHGANISLMPGSPNLNETMKDQKNLNNIQLHTGPLDIQFDSCNEKEIKVRVRADKLSPGHFVQKALRAHYNRLVGDIPVDDIIRIFETNGTMDKNKLDPIKSCFSETTRARLLLEELESCNRQQFQSFCEALRQTNHSGLADDLQTAAQNYEKEAQENFEGQVIKIATNQNKRGWKVETMKPVSDMQDAVFISLPKKTRSTEILGLVVSKDMKNEDITRAADLISTLNHQVRARLLCKQNSKDPGEVYIRCLPSKECANALREMADDGFTEGPPQSGEFYISDGEDIFITSKGAVTFLAGQKRPRLRFYVNIDSARMNGHLNADAAQARGKNNKFVGHVIYNVGEEKQDRPRHGSLTVYLPKEEVQFYSKRFTRR